VLSKSMLLPDEKLERLLRVVQSRSPQDAASLLGSVLYRAGELERTVTCLEEVTRAEAGPVGGKSSDWLLLALAYHRLGNRLASRRCLEEAVTFERIVEDWVEQARDFNLVAVLEAQLLRKEIENQIRNRGRAVVR